MYIMFCGNVVILSRPSALCFQELHTSEMTVMCCDVGYVQSHIDVKTNIHNACVASMTP